MGNTPTDVGNTSLGRRREAVEEKHPHGRGEHTPVRAVTSSGMETPPRTWGTPFISLIWLMTKGNTPTDVGNTARMRWQTAATRKHPHGRGEHCCRGSARQSALETPPRTWGTLCAPAVEAFGGRNTPTDVGNTSQSDNGPSICKKHPHGRGEHAARSCPA